MKATNFIKTKIAVIVMSILYSGHPVFAVDFNTDILDASDKANIDFSRFSQSGYIMPGEYQMQVAVNGEHIAPSAFMVRFIENKKENKTQECLTKDIVEKVGLTTNSLKKIIWWNKGECADLKELPGVEVHPDIADGMLRINMPQAWLEYSDSSWLPPSRWDDGIPGLMLDYNINATTTKPHKGNESQYIGYNGTVGANLGAWRLRADYQGNLEHTTGFDKGTDSQFLWDRFYAYRAFPQIRSKLTLGENYVNSEIFSTWRYTGLSLESDDRMLPPKLRGYAPQITGVADTNARVVVSQQGRILYETTVPAGPFTIQDLDSSVRGTLDVEIVEQNGQKKSFQIDTAYVPYLTRPGLTRFKMVSGRSRTWEHHTEGPVFVGGEISRGITNQWTLYGGGIAAGKYNSIAFGVGRDLLALGTLSSDVTQSMVDLDELGYKQGKSWRLSYSKRFDESNTDITFAGYRFSERNYMTMQNYLDARYRDDFSGREKELYTITVNKNFTDSQTSVGLQFSHHRYWDQGTSDYYSLSVNRYFDVLGIRNISAGLTASRSKYHERDNDSVFLRLSIPWETGRVSYSGNMSNDRFSHTIGYNDHLNNGLDSYSLNVGVKHGGDLSNQGQISAYYSHKSPLTHVAANFSSVENGYTSYGISASGGVTMTTKGVALHSGGMNGGTRLVVDTDGIAGVPVNSGRVKTNAWGIGVVTDMSSYSRNTTTVDLNNLPENMEATRSVVESVLTEGAIGYREFEVLKGERLFAVLRMSDGTFPPFGASVTNTKGRELGMVSDEGLTWLSGVTLGEKLYVKWDGQTKCVTDIPDKLQQGQKVLLLCQKNIIM